MTSIRLLGGLGNQLFQLTAGLFLEQERGLRVNFDRSWFGGQTGTDSRRELELEGVIPPHRLRSYPRQLLRMAYSTRNPWLVRESGSDDVLAHARIGPRSWVEGYFQQARYADSVGAQLSELLEPRLARCPVVTDIDDVALHVRLGDYYDNPVTRQHHGLLEPAYFERALDMVRRSGEWRRIVVFTDSPEVFEREYGPYLPIRWELATTTTAWDTLKGIAGCGAVVMSNSSLSWWGSFLAGGRTTDVARVVFPRPWFREPSPADRDLPVRRWTALPRVPEHAQDGGPS